ncbi:PEGA domain-containing protein [bacterium]|nr:PEGA domain-containing protein [bacterium]
MKKFIITTLFIFTSLLFGGKPTVGIIEFETQSAEIQKISAHLYQYLRSQTITLVGDKYLIAPEPTMNLQDTYLMLGCSSASVSCMKSIGEMMKVDYLLYGSIKLERSKYVLTLDFLDVKKAKSQRGQLIGDLVNKENMNNNIDTALRKMFNIKETPKVVATTTNMLVIDVKNGPSELYLNGKYVGVTPLQIKADDMPAGEYQLSLKKEGFVEYKEKVVLSKDKELKISKELEKEPLISLNSGDKKEDDKKEVEIAALKKDPKENPKKLDIDTKDQKISKDIENSNKKTSKNEWYQEWWVWGAAGGVAVITIVAVILLLPEDESSTPTNNVIISF